MKRKLFLFTLAAMLFGYCGAYAEPINGDGDTLWTKHMSGVTDIKFHPSGETVFVTQEPNEFYEISATNGEFVRKFKHPDTAKVLSRPKHFDISKSGKKVVSLHHEMVYVWDYDSMKVVDQINQNSHAVFFGNNDQYLYGFYSSADNDGYVWVYDINAREYKYSNTEIIEGTNRYSAIATSPDGKYFAVAGLFTNFGETTSTLALYDATTFEKIGNIVDGIKGSIEKIQFSENSKWMIINTHVSFGEIIDLEEFLKTKTLKRDNFQFALNLKFLEDEKHIIYGSDYPLVKSYIINYLTKDTVYYINRYLGGFEFNNSNHNFVCSDLRVSLFNSNWYYSDVPEITDTDLISNITYQNGTLKYSSSLENVQSIKITDLSGKLVFQSTAITQNNAINIALTKGIYFLTFSDGKSEYSKKFMVME